jgi:hypothetical protein
MSRITKIKINKKHINGLFLIQNYTLLKKFKKSE